MNFRYWARKGTISNRPPETGATHARDRQGGQALGPLRHLLHGHPRHSCARSRPGPAAQGQLRPLQRPRLRRPRRRHPGPGGPRRGRATGPRLRSAQLPRRPARDRRQRRVPVPHRRRERRGPHHRRAHGLRSRGGRGPGPIEGETAYAGVRPLPGPRVQHARGQQSGYGRLQLRTGPGRLRGQHRCSHRSRLQGRLRRTAGGSRWTS